MTKEEVFNFLIENSLILEINGDYVLSSNLTKLFGKKKQKVTITGDEFDRFYNSFPFQHTTPKGDRYTVKTTQRKAEAVKKLLDFLKQAGGEQALVLLCESVKDFYAKTSTPPSFDKYFLLSDAWLNAYQDYLLNKGKETKIGYDRTDDV